MRGQLALTGEVRGYLTEQQQHYLKIAGAHYALPARFLQSKYFSLHIKPFRWRWVRVTRRPASVYSCDTRTMLEINNLSRRFANRAVLRNLDLRIEDGQYIAIVGESGIGKSTLLNLIAGLDTPDAGRLVLDAVDYSGLDEDALTRLRRDKLGFVFQAFHVLPHLTVRQNVALPLWLQGVDGAPADDRAQVLLEAVGLGERSASWPRELSGGEMQRVAIARALVHRPRLVLADEPTGNLDPTNARKILQLLATSIRESGAMGILVTHSMDAAATADRIVHLTSTGLQS